MKQRFVRQNGFSLIEVLVVIVITGILAAVGVPKIFEMVERTNRKIDVTSALELAHILERAYHADVIHFDLADAKNNLKPEDMTATVIVANNGINYYSGSGKILVNGQTWEADRAKGENFARFHQLFTEAGFENVRVHAKNTEGGWSCFGAILFSDGSTRIISGTDDSKCLAGNKNHETFAKGFINAKDNPIMAYMP